MSPYRRKITRQPRLLPMTALQLGNEATSFTSQDRSEPRWYGYALGKWEEDTTFVVQTVGLDARTWIDNAGRPHSGDLRVEERFHRVSHDILDLTLTIIDPTMY